MADDDLKLAAEFPPATREQWLKLVDKVLDGASFDRRLVSKTADGLRIEPLYPRATDATPVAGRTPGARWQIMQRIDLPDPAAANAEALHELANGADGLTLVFRGSVGDFGFGLDATEAALTRLFAGIQLDARIALEFDLGAKADDIGPLVAKIALGQGSNPANGNIRFGFDPLGQAALWGAKPSDWATQSSSLARLVAQVSGRNFKGPFAVADGRIVHAAGGSEVQELAYVLAAGVAYLRAFEAGGMALDRARAMISFRLAADADQFLTIAKFRAIRKLWARVEEACGLAPRAAIVAAETAWRMMTQRDPWVNLLRTTIAAFSAGLGGADAVTVLPFTAALGLPDRFARRLARNTQLLLLEESNLAKVSDPAAGSGAFEDLTQKLCEAAWALFQEIEHAGGAFAALERGLLQEKIAAVRADRAADVAHGKDAITGTSEFPDIHELPVAVLAPASAPIRTATSALSPMRLSEPFEALRDAADRAAARGGRAKIFLASLGMPSDFVARATFAKNFFEAGGIEAPANDGFVDADGLAAAFKASGAKIACLCSSNDVYARDTEAAALALARAGARHIYMAGRAGAREAALKSAGVQSFVYAGCDMLATLREAHDILGIKPS